MIRKLLSIFVGTASAIFLFLGGTLAVVAHHLWKKA